MVVGAMSIAVAHRSQSVIERRWYKQEFDEKINFRVFRLQDNVMVAAPFGTIGKSVKIEDGAERRLKCEGIVVSEKVRAQNVG